MSKTIGILANAHKPAALRLIEQIIRWARRKGYRIILHPELRGTARPHTPARLKGADAPATADAKHHYGDPKKSDLILTLGGDGVLLHAATTQYPCAVPILTVNLGSLGFNAQTAPRSLFRLIDAALAGKAAIQVRSMLLVSVSRGKRRVFRAPALNDVVISKELTSRLINLRLRINGAYVTEYCADGLIVSTPTGSTAYNLAAGGPIVYPGLDAVVVSPLCPHALSTRTLVLPAESKIEIVFVERKDREAAGVTADGQRWQTLRPGDRIEVVRAPEPLRLVLNPVWNYFEALRKKLHWGGSLDA